MKIVNLLLDREAKIDVKNSKGETPLHLVIKDNKKEIVQLFQSRRPEEFKQISSDIDKDQRNEPEGFTMNKSVIRSNGETDMILWRKSLEKNWGLLTKKRGRFLVLAGIKAEKGKLGDPDHRFVEMSENQVPILKRKFANDMKENNIKITIEDLGKHINNSQLNEESLVKTIKGHKPTAIILAFGWSKESLIDKALQKLGAYADLQE
jgi:ankyrin repeat protein